MEKFPMPATITLDGKEVLLSSLSDNVKALVEIHNHWKNQQFEQHLENVKISTAIKTVEREIAEMVAAELKAAEQAENDEQTVPDVAQVLEPAHEQPLVVGEPDDAIKA